jgi:predicted alpha-1,6-mannanase (GH76 family)
LGFPVKQDDKKVNRIQKKSNRAAKNLTGEQKILQDGIKMVLDGKKGYRQMSFPKIGIFPRKRVSICTVKNVQTSHFDTNKPLAHFLNKVACYLIMSSK